MPPLLRQLMKAALGHLGYTPILVGQDRVLLHRRVSDDERRVDFTDWIAAKHLVELLRRFEVDFVLDVGANTGQFGRALRQCGWTGRIVSFEPGAAARLKLQAVASADGNWTVHGYALGDRNGEIDLTIRAASVLTSILEPLGDHWLSASSAMTAAGKERVPLRRVDSLWDELALPQDGRRAFLKIDTQGYDEVVVRGATGIMRHLRGIQTEVAVLQSYQTDTPYQERLAILENHGFLLSGLYGVAWDHSTGRLAEFDAIMINSEPG